MSSEQLGLELWSRDYDLPPRWDGLPVEWGQWDDPAPMFICPPPKQPDRCGQCGSTSAPLICSGRIWTDPASAPPGIGLGRLRGGRHLVGMLLASRCPDCRHDVVLDAEGQPWDLDDTDYGDDGSFDIRC